MLLAEITRERELRAWRQALDNPFTSAITGARWEQAACTAEERDMLAWDRVRPDGTLHMPWVAVHSTPCPGAPWTTEPDRWRGSLYCGLKHWHSRASLGMAAAGGASRG